MATHGIRRSWRIAALLAVVLALPAGPSHASARAGSITDYRVIFEQVHDRTGTRFIAVRRYMLESSPRLLLVNPQTLESSVVREAGVVVEGPADPTALSETPFVQALHRFTSPPYQLQNYGAVHAGYRVDGMYLTVDMDPCPKAMDREMFWQMEELAQSLRGPVPVAVAVTGRWMERHPDEVEWLKGQVELHHLAITWVNHSYSHPYTVEAPLEHNFLLSPGVNFDEEILHTERLLLERGLVPSAFFRFPGLVANGGLIERLRPLSLIPVGSDAWLVKGERPKQGSFILVHANGNDPAGVNRLIHLLHAQPAISFLPLQTAFTGGSDPPPQSSRYRL